MRIVSVDDDRSRELAICQDFDRELHPSDNASLGQRLGRNRPVKLQLLEATDIDDFPRSAIDVCEAPLVRQALLNRQLAAFKPAANARSTASFLALGTSTGGLAFAAPMASTDSLSVSVRAWASAQVI